MFFCYECDCFQRCYHVKNGIEFSDVDFFKNEGMYQKLQLIDH